MWRRFALAVGVALAIAVGAWGLARHDPEPLSPGPETLGPEAPGPAPVAVPPAPLASSLLLEMAGKVPPDAELGAAVQSLDAVSRALALGTLRDDPDLAFFADALASELGLDLTRPEGAAELGLDSDRPLVFAQVTPLLSMLWLPIRDFQRASDFVLAGLPELGATPRPVTVAGSTGRGLLNGAHGTQDVALDMGDWLLWLGAEETSEAAVAAAVMAARDGAEAWRARVDGQRPYEPKDALLAVTFAAAEPEPMALGPADTPELDGFVRSLEAIMNQPSPVGNGPMALYLSAPGKALTVHAVELGPGAPLLRSSVASAHCHGDAVVDALHSFSGLRGVAAMGRSEAAVFFRAADALVRYAHDPGGLGWLQRAWERSGAGSALPAGQEHVCVAAAASDGAPGRFDGGVAVALPLEATRVEAFFAELLSAEALPGDWRKAALPGGAAEWVLGPDSPGALRCGLRDGWLVCGTTGFHDDILRAAMAPVADDSTYLRVVADLGEVAAFAARSPLHLSEGERALITELGKALGSLSIDQRVTADALVTTLRVGGEGAPLLPAVARVALQGGFAAHAP